MRLGERIAALREARGKTKKDLAAEADCKAATLADWEAGRTEPSFGKAMALAEALGVPISALADDRVCEMCARGIERGTL